MARLIPHLDRVVAVVLGAALIATSVLLITPAATAKAARPSTLVEIRAAHHPGFDRVVFEFRGPLPDTARVRWAEGPLRLMPSRVNAHVQGAAFLRVYFTPAVAHQAATSHAPSRLSSFGPERRGFDLPNIAHVVLLRDSGEKVTVGIGLMTKTRIVRVARLTKPSRLVVDVSTRFKKDRVRVYFADEQAVIDGVPPYVVAVTRTVPRSARAKGALRRLYAGPTLSEQHHDLHFMASGSTGFRGFWRNDRGVARVTLRGPCDSGGSALMTVADQIMPTLRSRPAIDWVKIYDRHGVTEQPWGRTDSIPFCLEP